MSSSQSAPQFNTAKEDYELWDNKRKSWNAISVDPAWDPFPFVEHVIRGIYEEILCPGDVAIDGGANRGMHTLPMSDLVADTGYVFGIEAIPSLADSLKYFIREFDVKNVQIVGEALGAEDGDTEFNIVTKIDCLSGIRKRPDLDKLNVGDAIDVIAFL